MTELEQRLERYPVDRYPIQHATVQFHFGIALADTGDLQRAEAALVKAAELFDPHAMPVEHAKALNALGGVLRLAQRSDLAAQAFRHAAAEFERAGQKREQGAAVFNIGLVEREQGEPDRAVATLARSRELFEATGAPPEATAAVARELGAALLERGDPEDAMAPLEAALELGRRHGDAAGVGMAANALGLAQLALGRPGDATESLRTAAAAHPRNVRPAEFAMAQANLALAHERTGERPRARLAARHALSAPEAPPPVTSQAREVLDRLGDAPGDLVAALAGNQPEDAAPLMRLELMRWARGSENERRGELGAWIEGLDGPNVDRAELHESFIGALLELPPDDMDRLIRGLLAELQGRPQDFRTRFKSELESTFARFHVPQWMRLRDKFNAIATELAAESSWR